VKSIAVLPFKPLVAQSRNESLEIGMADTLITKLSNIKQLIVRPTSTIRKYTGLDQDALAAGRELGVDYVLEGNLQMEGEKTRATVRLLSVKDGSALWTDKCDQACSTIFELQDSVAQQIAGKLAIELTGDQKKQLAKHYTENTEAYQLALRGRFYWSKWTPAAWNKSIEFYHQALEKDPRYALAYAWMAATYNVQANIAVVPPKEAYTKAKELAEKALEIDDGLADGHYVMAALKMFYEWDWPGAERELERAIALNPQDAEGRLLHSYYSMITGHPDESLTKVKRCEELNPISPFISTNVADMLYFARHYDEAIEQYRKTLDLDLNHSDARRGLAMAYVEKGMHQESILLMNKSIEFDGDNKETSPSLGYIYALAGNKTAARVIANNLERLSKQSYYDPIKIAYIYAALGEKDRAFDWLEKAYDERSVGMQWINVTPRLDNLRADPRFSSLQRRIGLPV
jgi:TolB-like protein